mmetsp:Transcript_1069/g.1659  ORF Transcript_1069/g.1659 Transcript_1069/m.1659 type:complete len:127 (-) Transcript_1069:415-795(-)
MSSAPSTGSSPLIHSTDSNQPKKQMTIDTEHLGDKHLSRGFSSNDLMYEEGQYVEKTSQPTFQEACLQRNLDNIRAAKWKRRLIYGSFWGVSILLTTAVYFSYKREVDELRDRCYYLEHCMAMMQK